MLNSSGSNIVVHNNMCWRQWLTVSTHVMQALPCWGAEAQPCRRSKQQAWAARML